MQTFMNPAPSRGSKPARRKTCLGVIRAILLRPRAPLHPAGGRGAGLERNPQPTRRPKCRKKGGGPKCDVRRVFVEGGGDLGRPITPEKDDQRGSPRFDEESGGGERLERKRTRRSAAEAGPSGRWGGEGREGRRCPATLVELAQRVALPADAVKWAAGREGLHLPPKCKTPQQKVAPVGQNRGGGGASGRRQLPPEVYPR